MSVTPVTLWIRLSSLFPLSRNMNARLCGETSSEVLPGFSPGPYHLSNEFRPWYKARDLLPEETVVSVENELAQKTEKLLTILGLPLPSGKKGKSSTDRMKRIYEGYPPSLVKYSGDKNLKRYKEDQKREISLEFSTVELIVGQNGEKSGSCCMTMKCVFCNHELAQNHVRTLFESHGFSVPQYVLQIINPKTSGDEALVLRVENGMAVIGTCFLPSGFRGVGAVMIAECVKMIGLRDLGFFRMKTPMMAVETSAFPTELLRLVPGLENVEMSEGETPDTWSAEKRANIATCILGRDEGR